MSETTEAGLAKTQPGQALPRIEENEAVSFLPPFRKVRELIAGYPAPRRPNRSRPMHEPDLLLSEELAAWDAASDEALEGFEDSLPE